MENALLELAERIKLVTEPITKSIEESFKLGEFDALLDLFKSLPDDIQNTELFYRISELKKAEITYDDIIWLQNNIGYTAYAECIRVLHRKNNKSELDKYVLSIIDSEIIPQREKVIILLAHFERLVYQILSYERQAWDKLKDKVTDNVESVHEMVNDSFSKLFVAGIVYIVFSNTDNYKNSIDKRIPFRNYILHKGIIDYSDEEINTVYETLVYFISELTRMEVIKGTQNEENH